jgi:hypothetical protein
MQTFKSTIHLSNPVTHRTKGTYGTAPVSRIQIMVGSLSTADPDSHNFVWFGSTHFLKL